MIHAPQSRASASRRRHRRGFTLMELIIVIGILVILMGLLIPILSMVNRQGQSTKTAATLSSIATALDSYRSDFGDYPRFSPDDPNFPNPLNSAPDRGARLLARALVGPAPANDDVTDSAASPADLNYAKTAFQDGHGDAANPFGFKGRRQVAQRGDPPAAAAYYAGKVYNPYLDPERFELRTTSDTAWQSAGYKYGPDAVILDPGDQKPILYYPALVKQPPINDASVTYGDGGPYIAKWDPATAPRSLYNAQDNIGLFEDIDLRDVVADPEHFTRFFFRELLGDLNQNGIVDAYASDGSAAPPPQGAAERPITQPYLLIAVGVKGNYYEEPITNFAPELPRQFPARP